jgi:hypothetical protein
MSSVYRRSRLRLRHAALLTLILLACCPCRTEGKNLATDCTDAIADWRKKGTNVNPYRRSIDARFNEAEKGLIEEALRIAVGRMQQARSWKQVQERYTYAWLTSSAINGSGLCNEADVRRNLLFHQLYWLSMPNGKNDTARPFPDVYIRKGYEKTLRGHSGWVARAPYDTVRIYWDTLVGEWRLSDDSKFEITLNNYFVNAGGVYSDPEYWAGTIAHEMGHNLGHRHPDHSDPDYSKYQINVLDEVIQNNGQDFKGSRPRLLTLHREE